LKIAVSANGKSSPMYLHPNAAWWLVVPSPLILNFSIKNVLCLVIHGHTIESGVSLTP